MRLRWLVAVAMLGFTSGPSAQTEPLLQLQGQPYFAGSMTLHFNGAVGQAAILAYGLNPLDEPLQTGKGPWYIGTLFNALPLGVIPIGGRIDFPFTMPPFNPAALGIPVVLQGYSAGQLSNPTTLPLDSPYYVPSGALVLASPQPQQGAKFGDRVAAGDLNADGAVDLVVGAWFEDYAGVDIAGRVYVFWGPSFSTSLALASPAPITAGGFGGGVAVTDLDGDTLPDLMVGEGSGYPLSPTGPGHIYIYSGNPGFSATPRLTITSSVTGLDADIFGRLHAEGDLNGDGFNDIAVGLANAAVGPLSLAGRVHVFWGPTFDTHTELLSPVPEASANFGTSLAIGDVDGDGLADLVEGSGRDDVGGLQNVGSVHVYSGGPLLALMLTISYPLPPAAHARFGDEVLAYDFDADGIAEIAVADQDDNIFVYWGPVAGSFLVIPKAPTGNNPLGAFGSHLEAVDVNDDGNVDLAIGNMFEGPLACGGSKGGAIHIALGPYFETFHNIIDHTPACGNEFGQDFSFADIDADGMADVLVGSPVADDNGMQNSGHISILYSN